MQINRKLKFGLNFAIDKSAKTFILPHKNNQETSMLNVCSFTCLREESSHIPQKINRFSTLSVWLFTRLKLFIRHLYLRNICCIINQTTVVITNVHLKKNSLKNQLLFSHYCFPSKQYYSFLKNFVFKVSVSAKSFLYPVCLPIIFLVNYDSTQ